MTYSELKPILQQPYSLDNFKRVLDDVFPQTDKYLAAPQQLFEEHEKVIEGFQFGNIQLSDGKSIALFDVKVADSVNISKNRKGLRDIAIKYIDNGIINGALVVFHSLNQVDYRLSFIAKQSGFTQDGDFETTQTAPKRYTYILGKNESCTTAAKRLLELKEKSKSLDAIIDAFNVEKLNKDFFRGYKEHYERFWKYLNAQPEYRDLLIDKEQPTQDKAEKPIRDFAKKLLGRIVFMYFLQKKGWMGVPSHQAGWVNGNPNFIKDFFQNFSNKANFYAVGLVNLFFNTLNSERTNDIFDLTNTKIPYLNGGLFDNDAPQTDHFNFPENYFAELFDFFDQYNFTIDENDPNEQEVGIDPEMLGHIFENLLEENKDKGVFYTPKEIVQYMCQESLIQYLLTATETIATGEGRHLSIEAFVRRNALDRSNPKDFIIKNARKIEKLLDDVKICDPAIGSGAFPMGMLNEIFKAKMTLDLTLDPAEVKRHIIQHSIYGVDLDKGAVDIARLRFWLALVVDEDEPSPLPNLDYKIMQGNSLLESFEDIPLSNLQHTKTAVTVIEGGQQLDMFGNVVAQQTRMDFLDTKRQDLDGLIDNFFDIEDGLKKQQIRKQINEIVHEHLHYNVDLKLAVVEDKIGIVEDEISLITIGEHDSKAKKEQKQKALTLKQKALEKLQKEAKHLQNVLLTLDRIQDRNERPYFLWHLYFKDVFEQGGFDIVIGNPPYIQLQNDGGYLAKLFEKEGFETFERTGDIYSLFYEQGYKSLTDNGLLCYITSNKWMRAGYGESLRKFFAEKTNPVALIDFAGQKIFENATVDTNILLYQKSENKGLTQACIVKEKWSDSLNNYINRNKAKYHFSNADSWAILSPIEQRIKEKIERIGTPLKDWDIQINYGIKTGYNEAFIINGTKKDELIAADPKSAEIIRPILRGRDIKRYGYEFADLWLLYVPWHFPLHLDPKITGASKIAEKEFENQYPAVYNHLLSFKEQLSARNKDETGIRYEWYALQRWGANYWEDFFKPKIMYPNMTKYLPFLFDTKGFFLNDKGFIITGNHIGYLTAFLNSSLFKYCYRDNFPELLGGTRELRKIFFDKISVKKIDDNTESTFKEYLLEVQERKRQNQDTVDLEKKIDNIIFEIHELSAIEQIVIGFIVIE